MSKPWMTWEIDIPYRPGERERLGRLIRRLEHLEQRIETGNYLGEELFYDKGEASAIRYVLWELSRMRKSVEPPAPKGE